jgi:hypothetical protein
MGTRKNTAPATSSPSGYWNLDLDRKVEAAGFVYLPGHAHVVDDATLALIRAEDSEAVANVTAAA